LKNFQVFKILYLVCAPSGKLISNIEKIQKFKNKPSVLLVKPAEMLTAYAA